MGGTGNGLFADVLYYGSGVGLMADQAKGAVKAYDVVSGNKAGRDQAQKAADAQLAEQQKLQKELKDKQSQDAAVTDASDIQNATRAARRAKMGSSASRRDTILTSPLGVIGSGGGGAKTLLGE